MPNDMTPNAVVPPLIVTVFLLLGACASAPPSRAPLEAAGSEIASARSAGAQDYAPVELGRAMQWLGAADAAFARREYDAAGRNAEQAVLDAQLARFRSMAATAREQVRTRSEENARLRRELLGEGGSR